MGQSLASIYLHIIFSTKHRQPLIHPEIENELFSYIGAICKQLDCPPRKVGGYLDHIHIACKLSKNLALKKLLEDVKSDSSKWIKTKGAAYSNFYWQNGYGAFSVNANELDELIQYISMQKQHHAKMSFQDEFRAILKKYNVEYDELYVWD